MSADRFLWSRLLIGDACYQRLKRAATTGSGGSNAFFNKLLRYASQTVRLSQSPEALTHGIELNCKLARFDVRPELFHTAQATGSMPSRPVARCTPAYREDTSHARRHYRLRFPRAASPSRKSLS